MFTELLGSLHWMISATGAFPCVLSASIVDGPTAQSIQPKLIKFASTA